MRVVRRRRRWWRMLREKEKEPIDYIQTTKQT
jgi:hypothetical protein